MHLVLLDRWTELDSPLHRLDARSKIAGLGATVLFLLLSRPDLGVKFAALAAFLLVLLALSRVPAGYCLKRACLVLPFCLFAVATALAGRWLPGSDPARWLSPAAAAAIVVKAYLSALAVLLLVATTPLAALLAALEKLRVPGGFLVVVHFLYRYLFVLSEEIQHMHHARESRAAGAGRRALFQAAAGSLAVLFARSHARAERVHRAMLSRGFNGLLPLTRRLQWQAQDSAFVGLSFAFLAVVQAAALYFR